jgi:hypothetical protein
MSAPPREAPPRKPRPRARPTDSVPASPKPSVEVTKRSHQTMEEMIRPQAKFSGMNNERNRGPQVVGPDFFSVPGFCSANSVA